MNLDKHEHHRAVISDREDFLRAAEQDVVWALEEAFPAGMDLICHHGDQRFLVVSLGEADIYGHRLQVENPNTGKVSWRYWRNLHHLTAESLHGGHRDA